MKDHKVFKSDYRNWIEFRKLPDLEEHSMHWQGSDGCLGFHENMAAVLTYVERALRAAQQNGKQYVMFCHGRSTSGIGTTSTRSQVRKFMRSKAATELILRKNCFQHDSVFVAAIRPPMDGRSPNETADE